MKLLYVLLLVHSTIVDSQFTCDPHHDCNLGGTDMPSRVPDPDNCNRFYRCKEDPDNAEIFIPKEPPLECGEGFYFNGDPSSPGCTEGECSAPKCNGLGGPCKTSCAELDGGVGKVAYPGDCSKFYKCYKSRKSAHKIKQQCPSGKLFTGEKCEKVKKKEACCEVCGVPECQDDLELPDRSDISKYYYCIGNDPFPQSCPDGEAFDILRNECYDSDDAISGVFCPKSESESSSEEYDYYDDETSSNYHDTSSDYYDTSSDYDDTSSDYDETSSESEETRPDRYGDADDCIDITTYNCIDEGYYPLCETCNREYLQCISENGGIIPTRQPCPENKYLYPDSDYLSCIDRGLCEDLLSAEIP